AARAARAPAVVVAEAGGGRAAVVLVHHFGVFVLLVPLFLPLPFMVLFLFTGAIQAVIFATLTASYVGEALEGHGGGGEHHD
ncbi:MAG: hypothetical protein Q6K08_03190, partial [Thermostichales cyanobacterium GMQP_bins_62]